ncbi:MAG: hypothetical protein Q4G23_03930 [Clostridia bacterium]|nr:hypothetical protein [Clostridia bacterium]
MFNLPKVKQNVDKKMSEQFSFYGLKHKKGARDGDIYDLSNISFDDFPSVSARRKRQILPFDTEGDVYGIGSSEKLFWCSVSGKGGSVWFYYDGEAKFPVDASKKTFSVMNKYICIFPDKMYFSLWQDDVKGTYDTLEALNEAMEVSRDIRDGDVYAVGTSAPYSYFQFNSQGKWDYDATAENHAVQTRWIYLMDSWGSLSGCERVEENTETEIDVFLTGTRDDGRFYFAVLTPMNKRLKWIRVGDIVQISLKTSDGVYTKHYVTVTGKETEREYKYGKDYHFFYINANVDRAGKEETELTVERVIPDLEFTFCHNNRLWGIDDNKICASKLGDPFNFQDYSTIADASWAVAVASSGPFTGGIAYNGYPTFFKEDSIIKVSGAYPAQFSTFETVSVPGVKKMCDKSLAISNGVLYYLSPEGVCAYTGSYPYMIGEEIGKALITGIGGAGADKYFLEAMGYDGVKELLVYDTSLKIWTKEESLGLVNFTDVGREIYALTPKGIYLLDSEMTEGEEEADFESFIEFAPIYESRLKKKGVSRLHASIRVDTGAEVRFLIAYDGEGYKEVMKISPSVRRNFNIPLTIRRCGFYQLKIMAKGGYTLYGLGRERYFGTEY